MFYLTMHSTHSFLFMVISYNIWEEIRKLFFIYGYMEGRSKEMFSLMTHSTHFIYGYMEGGYMEGGSKEMFYLTMHSTHGKRVHSWCDGSSDRSCMGWTH